MARGYFIAGTLAALGRDRRGVELGGDGGNLREVCVSEQTASSGSMEIGPSLTSARIHGIKDDEDRCEVSPRHFLRGLILPIPASVRTA
jgi:hypothetical protein